MNTEAPSIRARGRGRGRTGKALRARGKRGIGRAATFGQRLYLEGAGPLDDEDEEAAAELANRFSKRELESNAHRFEEETPEPEEGEVVSVSYAKAERTLQARKNRRSI